MDCFLLIGRLYLHDLQDPKIALGAFERVLRIDPTRPEALEALSELYAHQGETRKALAVTERLVERESDPRRRRPFLLRLGTLWESAGDTRRAGVMLRRAVDESPRDLQALGELVRFHERQRELPARNMLLDGSLALLREDLAALAGHAGGAAHDDPGAALAPPPGLRRGRRAAAGVVLHRRRREGGGRRLGRRADAWPPPGPAGQPRAGRTGAAAGPAGGRAPPAAGAGADAAPVDAAGSAALGGGAGAAAAEGIAGARDAGSAGG